MMTLHASTVVLLHPVPLSLSLSPPRVYGHVCILSRSLLVVRLSVVISGHDPQAAEPVEPPSSNA